jgi:hypothetical protein
MAFSARQRELAQGLGLALASNFEAVSLALDRLPARHFLSLIKPS